MSEILPSNPAPVPAPPAPLPSLEDVRASLAAELDRTKRELWVERALRQYPVLRPAAAEFLTGADEAAILARAERLAILAAARA